MAGAINPVDIRPGVLGNLKVNNLDSGQLSGPATFWRGDGHWANPGYGVGSGQAVTQLTSITTAVTINRPTGQITTVSNAFTAGTLVSFTVNNTFVAATDTIVINANPQGAIVYAANVAANSFLINIYPVTSGTNSILINFAILKGANS